MKEIEEKAQTTIHETKTRKASAQGKNLSIKPGKIGWTPKEDAAITAHVQTQAKKEGDFSWKEIAKKLDRTTKQVRERWLNVLNPSIIEANWTEGELAILVAKQAELGNKWAEISTYLPGRPELHVKNKFYAHQRKEKRRQSAAAQTTAVAAPPPYPKRTNKRLMPVELDQAKKEPCAAEGTGRQVRAKGMPSQETVFGLSSQFEYSDPFGQLGAPYGALEEPCAAEETVRQVRAIGMPSQEIVFGLYEENYLKTPPVLDFTGDWGDFLNELHCSNIGAMPTPEPINPMSSPIST